MRRVAVVLGRSLRRVQLSSMSAEAAGLAKAAGCKSRARVVCKVWNNGAVRWLSQSAKAAPQQAQDKLVRTNIGVFGKPAAWHASGVLLCELSLRLTFVFAVGQLCLTRMAN